MSSDESADAPAADVADEVVLSDMSTDYFQDDGTSGATSLDSCWSIRPPASCTSSR